MSRESAYHNLGALILFAVGMRMFPGHGGKMVLGLLGVFLLTHYLDSRKKNH